MRHRDIIDRLEEQGQVPEQLSPDCIEEMLERSLGSRAVITEERPKKEIRVNDSRAGALRSAAAAAAFVLAVGAVVFLSFGGEKPKSRTRPLSQPPQLADCTDLEGYRGGTLSELYSFVSEKEDAQLCTDTAGSYAYQKDQDSLEKMFQRDKEVSQTFRAAYQAGNALWGEYLPTGMAPGGSDPYEGSDGSALVVQNGMDVFAAGLTSVTAYRMQGGDTRKIDYDFLGMTYAAEMLGENGLYQKYGHTPKLYVLDLRTAGDKLIVTYDFHLPLEYESGGKMKNVMHEYCGISVFDISDIDNISLVYEFEQPGVLTSASLTEDGAFAIVSQYRQAAKAAQIAGDDLLPGVFENGQKAAIRDDSVYIAIKEDTSALTFVSSFAVKQEEKEESPAESSSTAWRPEFTEGLRSAVEAMPGGEFFRQGTAVLGMRPLNVICQGKDILMTSFFILPPAGNSDFTEEHRYLLTQLSFSGAPRIVRSAYADQDLIESFGLGWISGELMTGFSRTEDYWYLIDDTGDVYVFDNELVPAGGYKSVYPDDYYYYQCTLSGQTLYIYRYVDVVTEKYDDGSYDMEEAVICTRAIDLSDPDSPVITEEPKVALYGSDLLSSRLVDRDKAMSLDFIYDMNEDGEYTADKLTVTLEDPTEPELVTIYGTDMTYQWRDSVIWYDGYEEQTSEPEPQDYSFYRGREICSATIATGDGTLDAGPDFGVFYSPRMPQGMRLYGNGLVLVPYRDIISETRWISEEDMDYEESKFIISEEEDEDGNYTYEVLDSAEYTLAFMVFEETEGGLEELGLAEATEIKDMKVHQMDLTPGLTGSVTMNGKLYAFTDIGMACTNLKTMETLYSDSF